MQHPPEELETVGYRVIPMFIGWKVQSAIALEKSGAGSGVGAVDVLVVQASPNGPYLEYCSQTMREIFPNEEVPFELWDSIGDIQFGHLTLQAPCSEISVALRAVTDLGSLMANLGGFDHISNQKW